MGYEIKPKPVFYNGLYFRSRLECRWAAFFDMMGISYEYEPDYVTTEDWLPDFEMICNQQFLIEIKPLAFWNDELFEKLFKNSKNYNILIFHEEIYSYKDDKRVYIGKALAAEKKIRLLDFSINTGAWGMCPRHIMNFWKEAKNKTMYLQNGRGC